MQNLQETLGCWQWSMRHVSHLTYSSQSLLLKAKPCCRGHRDKSMVQLTTDYSQDHKQAATAHHCFKIRWSHWMWKQACSWSPETASHQTNMMVLAEHRCLKKNPKQMQFFPCLLKVRQICEKQNQSATHFFLSVGNRKVLNENLVHWECRDEGNHVGKQALLVAEGHGKHLGVAWGHGESRHCPPNFGKLTPFPCR